MKNWITFSILLSLLFSACSEIDQDEMILPDVSELTPKTIITDLPIINISADQNEFDELNSNGSSLEEIEAKIHFYDKYFEPIIKNRSVKIEIKGASSRAYDLKSLGITFDSIFDNTANPILPDKHLAPFHSLNSFRAVRLRNSGQDFKGTMIKDMAYTQFAIGLGLDFELMYGKSATHVFVNNKYLGLLNLRTESNILGMSSLFNKDTSEVVIYKVDSKNQNIEHHQGNFNLTLDLEAAVDEASPEELYKLIDVSSFIDYLIYQDYVGNNDWPHNNIRLHNAGDNGFRFVLFDLDWAGIETRNAKIPELEYLNYDLAKIYQKFMQFEGFEAQMENRKNFLYERFKPEDFNAIVDELASNIENDIIYQIAKYGEPESMYKWKMNLTKLKRDFERRDHHIRRKYNLPK